MKEELKDTIKRLPIYTPYRRFKLRKLYAEKYKVPLFKVGSNPMILSSNLDKILEKAKIKNVGYGDFFYSLDTTIIIDKRNRVIDNIPIDYSYIVVHSKDIDLNVIKEYVKKINDSRVTLDTPNTLKEALQSILFWNSLLWQTGHTLVGLGRLDKVLAKYPIECDSEELICDFLKTLHTDYEFKSSLIKGDTGQIIVLGGLDADETYFCNEYTYLFIKCLKKINLPDPKILLRCSRKMPMDLLESAVECVATGIGSPLFSNDDIIVKHLLDFGYEKKDAYNYGVSACWEPLSIGNSLEQNNLDNILYGQCISETILDRSFVKCSCYEELISLFADKLKAHCEKIKLKLNRIKWAADPLLSLLMGLENDISLGSAKYNDYGILSVGVSSAVNSLLNIKKFVFLEKKFNLSEIQTMVKDNNVELFIDNKDGFGTDSEVAIELTNYLIKITEEQFQDYKNYLGGKVKFGLSSPSYITLGEKVGATLDGRKAGEPFQTHISRDKGEPITEIMNFESKLSFSGLSCNANVIDVMVQPSLIINNTDKFAKYVMGGIKEGIFQLQINVLSYSQLVDAKVHPENYPDLIVRVWGFSAYFNDLPEEYKDNLIRRAKEMEHIA